MTAESPNIRPVEDIFRALSDPHRRRLLDRLFDRDGQTLGQLCEGEAMTRFGVMKHLRVLENAGLVVTRKAGREKLHFLNPVPIRLIHDRWISKYAAPWVSAMSDLKTALEDNMKNGAGPTHVYQVFIRTTADELWEAITNGDVTRQYYYGAAVESTWANGAPLAYKASGGETVIQGSVIEADRPRRLVHTFAAVWNPETADDKPSKVTWEIEPMGDVCRLTLTHDDFGGDTATSRNVHMGWNPILSGLKTLLETGKPLEIPAA